MVPEKFSVLVANLTILRAFVSGLAEMVPDKKWSWVLGESVLPACNFSGVLRAARISDTFIVSRPTLLSLHQELLGHPSVLGCFASAAGMARHLQPSLLRVAPSFRSCGSCWRPS